MTSAAWCMLLLFLQLAVPRKSWCSIRISELVVSGGRPLNMACSTAKTKQKALAWATCMQTVSLASRGTPLGALAETLTIPSCPSAEYCTILSTLRRPSQCQLASKNWKLFLPRYDNVVCQESFGESHQLQVFSSRSSECSIVKTRANYKLWFQKIKKTSTTQSFMLLKKQSSGSHIYIYNIITEVQSITKASARHVLITVFFFFPAILVPGIVPMRLQRG